MKKEDLETTLRHRLAKTDHSLPKRGAQAPRPAFKAAPDIKTKRKKEEPFNRLSDYSVVKMELHRRLLEFLSSKNLLQATNEKELTGAVQSFIEDVVQKEPIPLNEKERDQIFTELKEESLGVGPLATLMADPAVTDILVNGPKRVYIERFGRIEKTDIRFHDDNHLVKLIQRIVSQVGRHIDEGTPLVDARLQDGTRVNATLPPITMDGPTLSIRRFGRRRLRMLDLIRLDTLSPAMSTFLELAVRDKINMAISGGSGAGKSTLLGAIADAIPENERILTIEDTAELQLEQDHVVRMETRNKNIEGQGEITARHLLINALRMRPDRIIVGEVRGEESLDMLQAMNTGHEGSLTTLHANSPRDALARLETMVLMSGADLPSRAIREQFVSALDFIVHVQRYEDGVRRVSSITEIVGIEGNTPQSQEIFKFVRLGRNNNRVVGEFRATGIIPRFIEQLRYRGEEIPIEIFKLKERKANA